MTFDSQRRGLPRTTRFQPGKGPCAGIAPTVAVLCLIAATASAGDGPYRDPVKLRGVEPDAGIEVGTAVAVSSGVLAAGAPDDFDGHGAVHLYVRQADADPVWQPLTVVPPPDDFDDAAFGESVDVDGDRLIGGAPWSPGKLTAVGAAFIHERDPASGVWERVAWLVPPDTDDSVVFGTEVAIDGDDVAVSAPLDELDGETRGSVYLYRRTEPGPVWSWVQKLRDSEPDVGYNFGFGLDLEGDRLAAGDTIREAVYVFERPGPGGEWAEVTILEPPGGSPADFGRALALSGDSILVGAPGTRFSDVIGAAYVFDRQPDGRWEPVAELIGESAQPSDNVGFEVALEGDTAVLGMDICPGLADCGDAGSVYVFQRDRDDPSIWAEVAGFGIEKGYSVKLGYDVGIDHGVVVAGAYQDREDGYQGGATYVFEPEECVVELALERPAVAAGETLRAAIHLEHRRLEKVTVPFVLWLEDAGGDVLAEVESAPVELAHGDVRDLTLALAVPRRAEPGLYRVRVGIQRMQQGVAWAEAPLRIAAGRSSAPR